MHSPDCLIKLADVGAAMLAEPDMDATTFHDRMRERFGRDYTDHRTEVFETAFKRYMNARSARAEGSGKLTNRPTDDQTRSGYLPARDVSAATKEFRRLTGDEARATEQVGASEAALAEAYAKLEKTSTINVLRALKKAGFLLGIFPSARNAASNTLQLAVNEATTSALAPALDAIVAADTNTRTYTIPTVREWAKAGLDGARTGVVDAVSVLRKGATPEQLERLELPPAINSGYRYLDTYINLSFRVMTAGDALLRGYAAKRSLAGRARARALTEQRAGKISKGDVAKRAQELYANPPADMELGAAMDAEFTLFNSPNKLATAIEQGKTTIGPYAAAATETVLTYTKVPTNVGLRTMDLMGAGIIRGLSAGRPYLGSKAKSVALKPFAALGVERAKKAREAYREIMKDFGPEDQQRMVEMTSRGAIGPVFFALGVKAGLAGLASGQYVDDSDAGERRRDQAAGRPEGSVFINGEWHDIRWMGPATNVFLLGATMVDTYNDRMKNPEDRPKKLMKTGIKSVLEMSPFLESAQEAWKLVDRPDKWDEWLGDQVQSYIPGLNATLLRETANMIDTEERVGSGFSGAVERDIPGLREQLPVRRDATGKPLQHNRFNQLTKAKTPVANPYLDEARRLDITVPSVPREPGEKEEAYLERSRAINETRAGIGERVAGSDAFKHLGTLPNGDDLQRKLLSSMTSDAKKLKLERPVDEEVFAHNLGVTARRLEVIDRLKADSRYQALDDEAKQAVERKVSGALTSARAKHDPDENRQRAALGKAQAAMRRVGRDEYLGQIVEKAFREVSKRTPPASPSAIYGGGQ